jgi:hypothetical protein
MDDKVALAAASALAFSIFPVSRRRSSQTPAFETTPVPSQPSRGLTRSCGPYLTKIRPLTRGQLLVASSDANGSIPWLVICLTERDRVRGLGLCIAGRGIEDQTAEGRESSLRDPRVRNPQGRTHTNCRITSPCSCLPSSQYLPLHHLLFLPIDDRLLGRPSLPSPRSDDCLA